MFEPRHIEMQRFFQWPSLIGRIAIAHMTLFTTLFFYLQFASIDEDEIWFIPLIWGLMGLAIPLMLLLHNCISDYEYGYFAEHLPAIFVLILGLGIIANGYFWGVFWWSLPDTVRRVRTRMAR